MDSSSSSSHRWFYDVFLSFRGEDVRKNFADHLYTALRQKGIFTFKDDERLERGTSIAPALLKAIEESRLSVIIFSRTYAFSSWCLDELVKIIECMRLRDQIVLPVFYDVDPSTVRKQKDSFGEAFVKHEADLKKEETLLKWRAALVEASNLAGWELKNTADGHESKCIQQIIEDIMGKLDYSIAGEDENLVGMESRMQQVYSLLGTGSNDVRIVGIWGMSGVGKTTLARAIFDKMSSHFEGASFVHDVRNYSAKYGLERLQKKLLSKILMLKDLKIDDVYEGIKLAKRRLRSKRILVVLDNIDHRDQLEALAGSHDWFGEGSRIIVTTKNKHLLVAHGVDRFYKIGVLRDDESIKLFSRFAFKRSHPLKGFEELSIEVVRYAGGLPLALKVLGSFLYGREMAEWKSTMERLKKIPEDEITEILRVSFDGLYTIDKEILLDIACFFKGKKKRTVTRILDSFDFSPVIGIKVLTEKSFVTVSKGRILMHELIQEMAWHIVRQKSPEGPGNYSRLWVPEDTCPVLTQNKGTKKIEGIWLDLPAVQNLDVNKDAFRGMDKLRLLKIQNVYVSGGPDYLPNELRWLNWHGYPSKFLPSDFQAEKLVCLKLQHSRIIQLWKGTKLLEKMKFINLSHSQKLIRTPDFTGIPHVEELILEDCSSLVEIHPSVGVLKKLVVLNLKDCSNLRSLPKSVHLESLRILILSGCSSLKCFPQISGNMNNLSEVYMEATAVKELPSSIELLPGLLLINLSYCKNLVNLPCSICRLKRLKYLILSGCSNLEKLPDDLGHIECLEELHLDETAIQEPPASISRLKNLKILSFRGCKQVIPQSWNIFAFSWLSSKRHQYSKGLVLPPVSGLRSLAKLDLSDCNMLEGGIPCDFGTLSSLVELNLSRNNFVDMQAASIHNLPKLRIMELVGCKKLQRLPRFPSSIAELYADDCISLKSDIDTLTAYKKLDAVSFTKCCELLQEEHYDNIVDMLWQHLLEGLSVENTKSTILLPGNKVPKWFSYQNNGPSISVKLPQSWYNSKFMGFAICVVSDLVTLGFTTSNDYLLTVQGVSVQIKITGHERTSDEYLLDVGNMGANENVDSEHTCLAYIPFKEVWRLYIWEFKSGTPNDWQQIDFSAENRSTKYIVFKSWGIRLLYEEDVRKNNEMLMIQEG